MFRRVQEWRCRRASEQALDEYLAEFGDTTLLGRHEAELRQAIRSGPQTRRDRRSWGYQKMREMVRAGRRPPLLKEG